MSIFLTLLPLVLTIVKELPGMIQAAENAFSGKPGSGAAKKDLVQAGIAAALDAAQAAGATLPADHRAAVIKASGSLIDTVVGIHNIYHLWAVPPTAPASKP